MIKRLAFLLMGVVFSLFLGSSTALALTTNSYQGVLNNTYWYDSAVGSSLCSVASSGGVPGATSGSWNSGLKPPYILEQFVIETLKDIAAKRSVAATNAVTQEHVIALVAMAWGEGGDINNSNIFNPFNTGINAPELIAGTQNSSGLESFKSFDAGVEATARSMVGPNQSRLADTLIQPTSTAEQFMFALSHPDNYAGNQDWAFGAKSDREGYFRMHLELVQQTRTNYDDEAATVIGTAAEELHPHLTEPGLLQFHASTSSSNSSQPVSCAAGGVVAFDIVQTALGLAWHNRDHPNTPTDAYAAAWKQYDGASDYTDCGAFVATVMRSSGVDPNYPKVGTYPNQLPYLKSHPEKYQEIDSVNSTSDLQPGDILITVSGEGHTYIYTGNFKGDDGATYSAVGASLGNHVPQADWFYQDSHGQHFVAFRLIK